VGLKVQRRIAQLEAQLAEREGRIAALESEYEARIAALESEYEARIAALEPELRAHLDQRDATITDLTVKLEQALVRIAELEAKLGQNSSNSSMPPSSDKPWNKPVPEPRRRGQRPRGGQKGHEGHSRPLVPEDKLRNIVDLHPESCTHCGSHNLEPDGSEPLRHQVTDLPPPPEPVTDEWRQHSCRCRECGHISRAELPPDVPRGSFGARVIAIIALMTSAYRLSRRNTQRYLSDLHRLQISLGGVSRNEAVASEAVRQPVEEARRHVEIQPVVHADETSAREAEGAKAWLWVAATALVTVFLVQKRRTTECAKALLGNFAGILVTDRYSGYSFWSDERRQFCWAHLKRDFQAMVNRGGLSQTLGEHLLAERRKMFALWHRVRGGTLTRAGFQEAMKPIRERVEMLIAEGAEALEEGICRKLLPHCRCLWTFVDVDGVEPTNNHAERQLRHGVILRKTSFGTQSDRGSRYLERMLTVVATLRQQDRNVCDYLIEACQAHFSGRPVPSLLPDHAHKVA
jgi:transposase